MASKVVSGVFSGSGMDLFDHAGAVWGLDEMGYRFRALAGVSGGSIIATALAAGFMPGQELNDLLLSFLPVSKKLLDPELKINWPWLKAEDKNPTHLKDALPWWWPFDSHGVVKGKKLVDALSAALAKKGIVRFKDVKIPLKIFTTNVTEGRQNEWSQETSPNALVAPVVVASCRIPGVFQGAWFEDHLHVDGGVWDNFPIDCFNKVADGTNNEGEGTIGLYFGIDVSMSGGLGYWPTLINVMMASRMDASLDDAPKAKVLTLHGGDSLHFDLDVAKAKTKLAASRLLAVDWVKKQG